MPCERVQSSENLAALMAPEDQQSAHLQRYIGPLPTTDVPPYQCFWEGPAGDTARKRFKIKYVRSRYMYENKQIYDKMPVESRTFMSKIRTFLSNRYQILQKNSLVKTICRFNLVFHEFFVHNTRRHRRPELADRLRIPRGNPAPGAAIYVRYPVSRIVAESHA